MANEFSFALGPMNNSYIPQNDPRNANTWWEGGQISGYNPSGDAPPGWNQFIAEGGDPSKKSNYDNWALQQQRNSGVESYVNRMADPISAQNTAGFNADLNSARGYLNPFLQTSPNQMPNLYGQRATGYDQRLQQLLDNPDSIQNSAAYKFRMEQGLDALNRQLGARGLLNSGNRLLETTKYGQGLASQEYGDQFKRLSDIYGTNANADIGQQNANTNAWQSRGNLLSDFYGRTSQNVNKNAEIQNNNRLGWAKQYSDIAPKPEAWGITNSW